MSVREYIGARYVPVIADPIEWDNTKVYEPLTIVSHEGNSYTSRQAVPAGIDITNTTFWALTGNYNAQIEQYRKEVESLREDVDKNTMDIGDETTARENADTQLQNKITNITNDIGAETTARENADTQLQNKITNLHVISLEDLGGKNGDSTFDNAALINGHFTADNAFDEVLLIPEGEWYIQSTVNFSYCEVIGSGVICCGDNFTGTPYVTSDGKNPTPAVIIGFGLESSYNFDNDYSTFIKNKSWNLNIDCKLKAGVSGLVVHRTWACYIHAWVRNALDYGVFTGLYVTESVIDASVGIFGQHGTEIVGNTGIASRSADYILNNAITMHYLTGIEFFAPNSILNYWHGYGYYDAAKNGVGIKFSHIGNITINTVFNDGCPRCFDFTPGNFRRVVSVVNYSEIGRTATNQLYLISHFDATWSWLTIDNLEIPFIEDDAVIKAFVCRYLAEMINQHHQGTKLNHLKINNFNLKRRVIFSNTSDPNWQYFDAWNLPICPTPYISISANELFTQDAFKAKHIFGVTETAGTIELSTFDNRTSFSTSASGFLLRIKGSNCIVENSVFSQGGEGSTSVNINVALFNATYSTEQLNL